MNSPSPSPSPLPSKRSLQFLTAVFVTTLIVSNIIAVKIGSFYGVFLPVAVVIFPVSYLLGDIITEVYGYAAMRRVIWTGFACNLIAVIAIWIGGAIPAAPFFDGQASYSQILGGAPRILAASFIAYLIGEFTNSMILAKLKIKTGGKHLWLRTISSTIVGEGLDSLIFITIAFGGVFAPDQIVSLVLAQWLFKVGFEVIATPLTYAVITTVKHREGVDVYDHTTSFNPFHL